MTDKITQINDEMSREETTKDYTDFRKELSELINKHSLESGSHTPDFVLSNFLVDVLICFDAATISRNSRHDFPARLCVLQRERDEARVERDDAKTAAHEWAVHATRRIRERDEWRECAERLSKALRCPCNFDERTCDRCEEIREDFDRLKGETK